MPDGDDFPGTVGAYLELDGELGWLFRIETLDRKARTLGYHRVHPITLEDLDAPRSMRFETYDALRLRRSVLLYRAHQIEALADAFRGLPPRSEDRDYLDSYRTGVEQFGHRWSWPDFDEFLRDMIDAYRITS